MRLIELHILQSFPVSCLNRDEVGQPKSAKFGGVKRARLSSQTLRRATRLDAACALPEFYTGKRTRYLPHLLAENVPALRDDPGLLTAVAARLAEFLRNKVDTNPKRFTTLVFSSSTEKQRLWERISRVISELSEQERAALKGEAASPPANQAAPGGTSAAEGDQPEPGSSAPGGDQSRAREQAEASAPTRRRRRNAGGADPAEAATTRLRAAFQESFGQHDAADIAIFGRMVADFPNLTVESAAMFSHALSTHEAAGDWDFFAAVDEQKPPGEAIGAAITDTLQFTSAVYYRYVGLNLGLLGDSKHLERFSQSQRQEIIKAFIRSTLVAVPGTHEDAGRRNSMNAHTEVGYALGFLRESAQPIQLVNAFEDPVRPHGGLLAPSVRRLLLQLQRVKDVYGDWFKADPELATGVYRPKLEKEKQDDGETLKVVPNQVSLPEFCRELAEKAVEKVPVP